MGPSGTEPGAPPSDEREGGDPAPHFFFRFFLHFFAAAEPFLPFFFFFLHFLAGAAAEL